MPNSLSPSDCSLPDNFDSPDIPGLHIPEGFYWVHADHPPLAGMRLPSSETPWEALHSRGFRWILCLCSDNPGYDPSPLQPLFNVDLTDLVETELPEDPDIEERAIRILATKIIDCLNADEGVVVHCAAGRGRTGTVLGAVLVKSGWPPDEVVAFLDTLNRERGRPGWPESQWQKKVVEGCLPKESGQELE